nr:hypothetical protein Q903MT_gene3045 [Picea sitchensis]
MVLVQLLVGQSANCIRFKRCKPFRLTPPPLIPSSIAREMSGLVILYL